MVSFLSKNGDTATIRCIFGEQSRINAALYGADRMLLDEILNNVNSDDNIKHVHLAAAFYEDESIIHDKIRSDITSSNNIVNQKKNNNKDEDSEDEDSDTNEHVEIESGSDDNDWKCPECSDGECLKDRQGNKYPCLSCLQIDIGQRILEKFGKEFAQTGKEINKTLNLNNTVIQGFFEYIKKCGQSKD